MSAYESSYVSLLSWPHRFYALRPEALPRDTAIKMPKSQTVAPLARLGLWSCAVGSCDPDHLPFKNTDPNLLGLLSCARLPVRELALSKCEAACHFSNT